MILSSISEVKNKEMKNEGVKNMYHYGNNYDDVYVNSTSATKLECLEWHVKEYRVNNNNINDIELK